MVTSLLRKTKVLQLCIIGKLFNEYEVIPILIQGGNRRPVNIDSLGNITGSPTIGKITVNSETEYSLTMDEYGVTNVAGYKINSLKGLETCLKLFICISNKKSGKVWIFIQGQ